jgi:thymidylate synthase ThyX
MPNHQIYLLSPKELSPETIAVAFAKTSRSPESFHEIAAGLNDEQSANFHEKWVVGYGHASVAEHAVLHLAFENVSRLATESIESNRLASYTEKSSRYQKWGKDDFYIPPELDEHPLREEYIQTCRLLFDTYAKFLGPVRELVAHQSPPRPKETDEAYDRRIRSQYADSCRFLLPAASLANLGMTANARVLENAIRKLGAHPLAEVRQIGAEMKRVAQAEVPTLVKYAEADSYLMETSAEFANPQPSTINRQSSIVNRKSADWCQLVDFDPDGETKVLAAALFRFGGMTYAQALQTVRHASEPERAGLAASLLGHLSRHDSPLRELEHTSYTFDLTLDQGAYAEFKRHRMMSQTSQALTTRLGYALPRRIAEAGLEVQYRSAMQAAAVCYEKLAGWNPHVAAYVVPNAFNRRLLFTMNLREAFAFCQLRAAANAHFSMRRVALRLAEEIRGVHPLLAKYLQLPEGESWQGIEAKDFAACG